jgi:hypothetical protein
MVIRMRVKFKYGRGNFAGKLKSIIASHCSRTLHGAKPDSTDMSHAAHVIFCNHLFKLF